MNILSLDTSTSLATVAVSRDGRLAAETTFNSDRTLSARLIPEIGHLLSLAGITIADIDLFGASVGPGSFTGVRGGLATLQGLALAGGKPCAAFSSLTLLAMNFSLATLPVCAMLDARKDEVYGALFDCSAPIPVPLIDDTVLSPERFLDLVRGTTGGRVVFCGDGALRYSGLISGQHGEQALLAPPPLNSSRASHGLTLALHAFRNGTVLDPGQLLPTYLRASEAEINRTLKL